MREKTKGSIFDSNDLKYFFSDSQIQTLENKAVPPKDQIMAEAGNIVQKFIANNFYLDYNVQIKLKNLFQGLSTKEKEYVAQEFTRVINEEESSRFSWFKSTKIKNLKNNINEFITKYINPSLTQGEWAIGLSNKTTGHYTIEIVDMDKIN